MDQPVSPPLLQGHYSVDDTPCKSCPLWETSVSGAIRRSAVYGRGTGRYGLMFITPTVNTADLLNGRPLTSRTTSALFSDLLRQVGISESECFITSTTRCRPPGDRLPEASEYKACFVKHGKIDFPSTRPKLIMLLGAISLKAILGLPKITERRGIFYDCDIFGDPPIKAMATFHPDAVLVKPAYGQTVLSDLRRAREFVEDIKVTSTLPTNNKILVRDKEQFTLLTEFLRTQAKEIAVDLETTGLSFYRNEIASISFSCTLEDGNMLSVGILTRPKVGWWHAELKDPWVKGIFTQLFNNHEIAFIFHNGDFDTKFLWFNGYYVKNSYDTIDAHLLLDENSSHKLKDLTTLFIAEKAGYQHKILEEVGDPAEIANASPEVLLDYNTDDTYTTKVLKDQFEIRLRKEDLWDFYVDHAMPTRRVFTKISFRGIMVDRPRVLETSSLYRAKIKALEKDLFSAVGSTFEWTSYQQLADMLYVKLHLPVFATTKKGKPSTNKETLKLLEDKHIAPALIIKMKHMQKMLTTYLDGDDGMGNIKGGMLQYLDHNDRIHSDFLTHGTTSGRPSAKAPSLLTIPRDPEIRMNFMAPPGWVLIDCDYSQAELVLLAFLSGDPRLIEAVTSDDMHLHTQLNMMRLTMDKVNKETRVIAKTINFRKAYRGGGRGAAGVLKMTEDEAEALFKKWDETYYMVPQWWAEQERQWRERAVIDGIYGRRRHFPPAYDRKTAAYYDRLSANFPCQNGVADTTNRSLYTIDAALERLFGWSLETMYQVPGIVLSVHDAIISEAPEEHAEDICSLMTEIMRLPLPKINISLKLDSKLVHRWGEEATKEKDKVVEKTIEDDIREELRDDQVRRF